MHSMVRGGLSPHRRTLLAQNNSRHERRLLILRDLPPKPASDRMAQALPRREGQRRAEAGLCLFRGGARTA
jgi:hypothetical protein